MIPDQCPHCKADLVGEPIPLPLLHNYGGSTHYMRTIAIYDRDRDRTVAWKCPDCGYEWERQ